MNREEAIAKIGTDGAVIVRPDGKAEIVDLKLGRKKMATKGSRRTPLKERASDELVAGYRAAQALAERRAESVPGAERGAWIQVASYCCGMADSRAVDDDQFKFQRNQFARRREPPMTDEEIDKLGLHRVWDDEGRGLPEWQLVALELALGHLGPIQRVCYEMCYGGRLSHKDIATALSMTVGEVKNALWNAKEVLRKIIFPIAKKTR